MSLVPLTLLVIFLCTGRAAYSRHDEDDYISNSSITINNRTVLLYDTPVNFDSVKVGIMLE